MSIIDQLYAGVMGEYKEIYVLQLLFLGIEIRHL